MATTTAQTIAQQIGNGALMSLGARALRGTEDSLSFDASILPMTKGGTRGTSPRTMRVVVTLSADDTYDIRVTYAQRGDQYGFKPPVVHFDAHGIYCDQLAQTMLALDYNGREVLNPRLAPRS